MRLVFPALATVAVGLIGGSVQAAPLDYLYLFDFETSLVDHAGTGTAAAAVTNGGVTRSTSVARNGTASARFTATGDNDGIRVDEDLREATFAALTWGAWVKSDGASTIQGILSIDNGNFDRTIGIDPRGSQFAGLGFSAFTGTGVVKGAPVTTDWTHLSAVYDGSMVDLYINGGLAISAADSFNSIAALTHFFIGANTVFNEGFGGYLDDVFVYGRALRATEIADIYTDGFAPVPLPAPLALSMAGLGALASLRRRRGQ